MVERVRKERKRANFFNTCTHGNIATLATLATLTNIQDNQQHVRKFATLCNRCNAVKNSFYLRLKLKSKGFKFLSNVQALDADSIIGHLGK